MLAILGAGIMSYLRFKQRNWLQLVVQQVCFGKNSRSHLMSSHNSAAMKMDVMRVLSRSYCSSSAKDALRAPYWRGKKVISLEAQRATTALRGAKGRSRDVDAVLQQKVARLLKVDMLSVLYLLQQQNETHLALQVFNLLRKENWYKPEVPLYRDMIEALGKNGQFEQVEKLFDDMQSEGLKLQMIVFIEIIQNCFLWKKFSLAFSYLEKMKQSECPPNMQVYGTFINILKKMGELELSAQLEKERLL